MKNIKITSYEIKELLYANSELYEDKKLELLAVWEKSVRATHTFITEEDIIKYKPLILKHVFKSCRVFYVEIDAEIGGFIGIAKDNIEMLFVAPLYFRQGIGRALLDYVVEKHDVTKVDVNEENPEALAFYQSMNFAIKSRSQLDEQGDPHPILHLELK